MRRSVFHDYHGYGSKFETIFERQTSWNVDGVRFVEVGLMSKFPIPYFLAHALHTWIKWFSARSLTLDGFIVYKDGTS
jgi:hypothetical protein